MAVGAGGGAIYGHVAGDALSEVIAVAAEIGPLTHLVGRVSDSRCGIVCIQPKDEIAVSQSSGIILRPALQRNAKTCQRHYPFKISPVHNPMGVGLL